MSKLLQQLQYRSFLGTAFLPYLALCILRQWADIYCFKLSIFMQNWAAF